MANELSNLKPVPGAQKARTRIGRGQGSGLGKTSGRGTKGQQSRAGSGKRPGFEGGQIPLRRRQPKHGFTNIFAKVYTEVNLCDLTALPAGSVVDAASLKAAGIISKIERDGIKVLGNGDVAVALTVKATKVSASAKAKIEAAGGVVEVQA